MDATQLVILGASVLASFPRWFGYPLGQTLIITSGLGWVPCKGGPDRGSPSMRRGMVSPRPEALARSHTVYGYEPYRHSLTGSSVT